jgi:hypothetical protein
VTVVADLPETGLVAVDPDDAELIRMLNEEARGRASVGPGADPRGADV